MFKRSLSIEETLATLRKLGLADRMLEKPYPKMFPDEPFFYGIKVEPFGHGYDFFNKEHAIWKAIGENTERVCRRKIRDYLYPKTFISSYSKLPGKALDPYTLAGFTKEQKKLSALQYRHIDPIRWVQGFSTLGNCPAYIPYQLIDIEYRELSNEPLLRWGVSTGLATSPIRNEAVLKGMLEVIERDAFMINYLNRLSPPTVNLEHCATLDEDIHYICKLFKEAKIRPHVTLLATDFPLYIGLGVLTDKRISMPRVSVGARASFSLKSVIIDSLTEALAVRLHQRTIFSHTPQRPFKRLDRLMYWAHKTDLSTISFLLHGQKTNFSREQLNQETASHGAQMESIEKHLRESNYSAYHISITPPQVEKSAGLCSIFSIIPDLQPMHLDESIPYFGGVRLNTVPSKLQLTPSKELNREPSPFV